MKLETENVQESEASAELIRELMADDARRGNWLILMHDDDEEAIWIYNHRRLHEKLNYKTPAAFRAEWKEVA